MPKGVYVRRKKPLLDRLLRKVHRQPNGCWIWTGTVCGSGYGSIGLGSSDQGKGMTHRVSWEEHRGPIPEGLIVCHRCDVKRCVNPDHLFLGTYQDNYDDAKRKGRMRPWPTAARLANRPRGERHGHAKLTATQVKEIRTRFDKGGCTKAGLATEYGVSRALIRLIVTGRVWKCLTEDAA